MNTAAPLTSQTITHAAVTGDVAYLGAHIARIERKVANARKVNTAAARMFVEAGTARLADLRNALAVAA
jgi:hypothetical protein